MDERHFACTRCGACCNRAPELELGEAAGLSDVFAWRLMFRLYSLPRTVAGYVEGKASRERAAAEFYQSKRLLSQFAAHRYDAKAMVNGAAQDRTFYLTISALALDLATGSCAALADGMCSIYERRPLACRAVPAHYSRPEAAVPGDFDTFVAAHGNACDTSRDAPLLIEAGRIVAPEINAVRELAARQADADRRWKAAIYREMKSGAPDLPTMAQVEQHASLGAITVPMRTAWRIARDIGLIDQAEFEGLLAAQIAALDRMAQTPSLTPQTVSNIADLRRVNARAS